MDNTDLLQNLNEEQKKAVTTDATHLLIVAGAGTGKTTVITRKIAWLIEQKKAETGEILALTFTDKASQEMRDRVDQLLPYGFVDVNISTFHSFCERVLRDHGLDIGLPSDFKLLNQTEQWLLVRHNLDKFELDYYRPLGNPTRFIHSLLGHFSRAKDEEILPDDYIEYAEKVRLDLDSADFVENKDEEHQEINRIAEVAHSFAVYQKLLLENSALDFGDLIVQTLRLFKNRPKILKYYQNKFKYILVDEFQDTNYAQYSLVKLLSGVNNNLTVVGDDDQSIYKFRGASVSNILHFTSDFPKSKKIFLTENYRSKQNILDLSYKFIQNNNPDRLEVKLKDEKGIGNLSKKLVAVTKEEGVIEHLSFSDQFEEAKGVISKIAEIHSSNENITFNDFAILARSHDALDLFITELESAGIPYIYVANRGLYKKSVILDFYYYFKLLDNYHESSAMYRTLKLPIFGIEDMDIVKIIHQGNLKSKSIYEALFDEELLLRLKSNSKKGIEILLSNIEKHTKIARYKSAWEVYVTVFNDLDFKNRAYENEGKKLEDLKYINAMGQKIQSFISSNQDKSLKAFLENLEYEMQAGDEGALEVDLDAGPEAVKVMTVHAGKGLEFSYVFVVGLVDKRFPTIERKEAIEIPDALIKDIIPEGDVHLQEERRLFYVAMTRAKKGLYLTRAEDYGGKQTKKPSRFLIELELATEEKSKPTGVVKIAVKDKKVFLPIPKSFSFSKISTFIKCPLEYKYRYLLGLPTKGSSSLSFGQTIHKVFEIYMKETQAAIENKTLPLFVGKESTKLSEIDDKTSNNKYLPDLTRLKKLYTDEWVDDWYESKSEKEKFRKIGMQIINNFYEECQKTPVNPKFIEKSFRLKVGKWWLNGKIDRADFEDGGLNIIDYKTGNAKTKLEKVDKQQLLIYQWAGQEYFNEKINNLEYWYLRNGLEKLSFIGKDEDIEELKENYINIITNILEATENDSFLELDEKVVHKDGNCIFRDLEV